MAPEKRFIDKELSWLAFNERVLQEAADKSNSLIERVRFLGIYSSNLDEFYKVRFAEIKRRLLINQAQGTSIAQPKSLLNRIQAKVLSSDAEFEDLYNDLLIEMARNQIFLVNERQLSNHQEEWLKSYFKHHIRQYIAPIILKNDVDLLHFLKDDYTYLVFDIIHEQHSRYALVEIPSDKLPRFVLLPPELPRRRKVIILLDNIIRFCADDIFQGFFTYDELQAYSMKMTRDAEYDLVSEIESSLLESMSSSLKRRLTAEPVRLVYQRDMPQKLVNILCTKLGISSFDSVIPGGRYHKFKDFIDFPNVGKKNLVAKPMPPFRHHDFDRYPNSFDAIRQQDILLYYPYYTFDHILELMWQASFDPSVVSIKINIYRVAKASHIIKSLIHAAHNGKKVTVVVELQARFDEEANIRWAKRLTEAGVQVLFSIPGLKIHAKLFLITRIENNERVQYAHIGTGNFNEKTARTYTDFSLFTAHKAITDEVRGVFNFIENPYRPVNFKHLLVSPQNCRQKLNALIDQEIMNAELGLKAGITLKLNNLADDELIERLYQASNVGVKIRLIIRGMCALIPGIEGMSENIEVISIVDRFLEHARVYIFDNYDDPQVFISSADWMTRNIDRRVEVGVKISHPILRQRILDIVDLQLNDTVKARVIDKDLSNHYVKRGKRRKIRSQLAIYNYVKVIEQPELTQPERNA